MRTLLKSALPASLKGSFFCATVESILLYGQEDGQQTDLRQDLVAATPDC